MLRADRRAPARLYLAHLGKLIGGEVVTVAPVGKRTTIGENDVEMDRLMSSGNSASSIVVGTISKVLRSSRTWPFRTSCAHRVKDHLFRDATDCSVDRDGERTGSRIPVYFQ